MLKLKKTLELSTAHLESSVINMQILGTLDFKLRFRYFFGSLYHTVYKSNNYSFALKTTSRLFLQTLNLRSSFSPRFEVALQLLAITSG